MSFRPTHPGVSAFRRWGGAGPALTVVEGGRVDPDPPAPDDAPPPAEPAVDVAALFTQTDAAPDKLQ